MAAAPTRLTFLYPHLFRTARLSESQVAACRRTPSCPGSPGCAPGLEASQAWQHGYRHHSLGVSQVKGFATVTAPKRAVFKRHGKAVEPQQLGETKEEAVKEKQVKQALEDSGQEGPRPSTREKNSVAAEIKTIQTNTEVECVETAALVEDEYANEEEEPIAGPDSLGATTPPAEGTTDPTTTSEHGTKTSPVIELGPPEDKKHSLGPMEAILSVTPLDPPKGQDPAPPHLATPPYVHHFDSYSLVKQLANGGLTEAQAITGMKAVRGLLAQHLELAQAGLVGKSDVENEAYLFKAACSELSAEMRNSRRVEDEKLRQQRTTLQHEVDMLGQSVNQELMALNDAVRGMFNDRRMVVREEQRGVDSKIQQLSYKISLNLNSDARSEIEQLRWVLIRRAAFGLLFLAVATLGTLRYATFVSHRRKEDAERQRREAEALRTSDGRDDRSGAADAAVILAAN